MGYSDIPQTTAMREGLEKEEEIAQVFISEMSKKGLLVYPWRSVGFSSASPMVFLEHLQTESFINPPRVTQECWK